MLRGHLGPLHAAGAPQLRPLRQGDAGTPNWSSAGALKELSKSFGLNLSGDEIDRVFGEAGGRLDGNVQYKDFMVKLQKNTGSKRLIPEFLKPKTMRRSQSGHIWAWNPDGNLPHKWQS